MGEKTGTEDLPDQVLPFTCTETSNLYNALWIVRPLTPEQHYRNPEIRQRAIAEYEAALANQDRANRMTIPTPKSIVEPTPELIVKQPPAIDCPTAKGPATDPPVKAPPTSVKAKPPTANNLPIDKRLEA